MKSALKAILRTPLFRQRVCKAKVGKGSYTRKNSLESDYFDNDTLYENEKDEDYEDDKEL